MSSQRVARPGHTQRGAAGASGRTEARHSRRGAAARSSPTRSSADRWRPARARRNAAGATLQRVAHAGARSHPAARGQRPGRDPAASRRRGGEPVARAARRDVRGDGRTGGDLCRARGRAHVGVRTQALAADSRGAAQALLSRRSAAFPRAERNLPQRDLCRRAQRPSCRNHADHAHARAAVPPRPVPQSRPAREFPRRTRSRRQRDRPRRPRRRGSGDARAYLHWCARNTSSIPDSI